MTGFSYKNFVLQIIQGSIILGALYYARTGTLANVIAGFNDLAKADLLIFVCLSFVIGVLVDFLADSLESLCSYLIKSNPPFYFLLKEGRKYGIMLAHYDKIFDDLCRVAAENSAFKSYNDFKTNDNEIYYLFQVAKNIAFRECTEYQKDQIESFFILYIFCRNLAISFIIISVICLINAKWLLSVVFILSVCIAVASAYRYFLYYSRILLGSTFKPGN
jgi:hypothetical protein